MFLSSFAKFFMTGSEYMAYLFVMRKFGFRGYKVSYPRKSDSLACCLATVTVVKNFTSNYFKLLLSYLGMYYSLGFVHYVVIYLYSKHFYCFYCFTAIVLLSSYGDAKITNFENLAFVLLFPKVMVCRTVLKKCFVIFTSYSIFFN